MEGSSAHEGERRSTFYVYHPCYFLQEALRALLKCLGIESGTRVFSQEKEAHKTSLPQICGVDPITNSPSTTQESSQDAVDPPSTTVQTINESSVASRRDRRRSGISDGRGPQHH